MPVLKNKQDSFSGLPFGNFLSLLADEGFAISVRDITEFTAVFNDLVDPRNGQSSIGRAAAGRPAADQIAERERLKLYLAPLICRNQAEQSKFYQLYDDFFITRKIGGPLAPPRQPKWKKVLLICGAAALLAAALVLIFRHRLWPKPAGSIGSIGVMIITPSDSLWVNHPITLLAIYSGATDTAVWTFDDGTSPQKTTRVSRTFTHCGTYRATARGSWQPAGGIRDSLTTYVDIPVFPAACLSQINTNYPVVGDTLKVLARLLDTGYRQGISIWTVTNNSLRKPDTIPFTETILRYVPHTKGDFTFKLIARPGICDGGPSLMYQVASPNDATLTATPVGAPYPTSYKPNSWWIIGLLGLFLLGIAAEIYALTRKKKIELLPGMPKEEFSGMAPPDEIPMQSRNNRLIRLQAQSKTAALLQQRIESDALYLHVPRTIRKSVANLGFPFPEYSPRYKDRNYLILIDASDTAGSQYIPLFTWLVKTFVTDNVDLNYYYYDGHPDTLYREGSRAPLYLNDIRDRHYGATLLVFSNGNNLMDTTLPVVASTVKNTLDAWLHRILITPVPALDWGAHEKILADYFSLVPADMIGLLNIVKFINDDLAGNASFKTQDWMTYRSKYVDVYDVQSAKKYLNDPDLFNWLAALAIYHKIRWEVIIEIGKTILAASGVSGKLNYNNLLRIARIKWIEEGAFPETIRLELLKELSVPKELLARRAMLVMLSESDTLIGPGHFSYEEKMIQRYTDSFIVFANDPVNGNALRDDAGKFLDLWKDNRIADSTLYEYLKNPDHQWTTPLNEPGGKRKNVNIGEFVEQNVRWRRHPLLYPGIIAACLSLILLAGLFRFAGTIYSTPVNSYLHLVTTGLPAKIDIEFTLAKDSCARRLLNFSYQNIALSLNSGNGTLNQSAGGNDSTAFVTLDRNTDFSSENIMLTVTRSDSRLTAQLPSGALYRSYELSVSGPVCNQGTASTVAPLVYIQYDPKLDSQNIEQLRQCATRAGFDCPGIEAIRPPLPIDNVIRFFNDSMQTEAQQLRQAINSCFVLDLRVERSQLRTRSNTLEVWINTNPPATTASPCQTVTPDRISGLKLSTVYHSDNMKTYIRFRSSQLQVHRSSDTAYQMYVGIKNCNGQYTGYILGAGSAQGSPLIDSIVFTVKNERLQIIRTGIPISSGNYSPIFDNSSNTILKSTDSSDIGTWMFVENKNTIRITADSVFFVVIRNHLLYRDVITERFEALSGSARIYNLAAGKFQSQLRVLLFGGKKYLSMGINVNDSIRQALSGTLFTDNTVNFSEVRRISTAPAQNQSLLPVRGGELPCPPNCGTPYRYTILWITDDPTSPYDSAMEDETFKNANVRFVRLDFQDAIKPSLDSSDGVVIVPRHDSAGFFSDAQSLKIERVVRSLPARLKSKMILCSQDVDISKGIAVAGIKQIANDNSELYYFLVRVLGIDASKK